MVDVLFIEPNNHYVLVMAQGTPGKGYRPDRLFF